MTRRLLSLFTALVIICGCMVASVSADEASDTWIDLLSISSLQDNGANWFEMESTTQQVTFRFPVEIRLRKLDMIVSYYSTAPITAANISYNGSTTKLNVVQIDSTTCRIYGDIPHNYYKSLVLNFTRNVTGKHRYQILACKASSLATIDNQAQGTLKRGFSDNSPITLPGNFSVAASGGSGYEYKLIPVTITDWRKYDSVTLFGSITSMALNSFRASVGSKGLDYEITYMESIPTSVGGQEWFTHTFNSHTETTYLSGSPDIHDETSFQTGDGSGESESYATVSYGGAVLYTVTIDLSDVDRTLSGNLECFFTCIADVSLGYAFNVQQATGSIKTGDVTNVSWWSRFTTFMRELFPSSNQEGQDFEDEAGNQSGEMSSLNDELQNVTRPNIEDVETDIEDYVSNEGIVSIKTDISSLLNHQLILTPLMISLTVALVAYILYGKR